ncbi:MAG: hypothetical protein Q4C30_00495 [Bacteroidia bacterium]|nr:hypothetical protein [Bacteroidia bacterium]
MKTGFFGKLATIAMMATAVAFTSCDDDDDEKFVPSFPESALEINDAEEGTCKVSFTANDVWTLSSDASWAVFENGTTTQGEAGEQNVEVKVTYSRENAGKTANLTLAYPNAPEQSMVIAKITLKPWVNEVKVVDAESIKVGFAGATIKITSNIACAASELPEFLTFNGKNTLELVAGENEVKIAYNESEMAINAPNKPWSGTINFVEEGVEAVAASIAIEYTGMVAGEMVIDIVANFGWQVDLNSQEERYYREMSENKMNVSADGIPFNVYAGEEVVFLHGDYFDGMYYIEKLYQYSPYKVTTTDNGYLFALDDYAPSSKGELYAIPASVFETMNELEMANGVEAGYLEDKYVVLSWEKAASVISSAEFIDQESGETITFMPVPDSGIENYYMIPEGHTLVVNIPGLTQDDFYNGNVFMSLRDMTFTDVLTFEDLFVAGKFDLNENGFVIRTDSTMTEYFIYVQVAGVEYYINLYPED